MTIDLRSDTVTRPTPEMLEAMFSAPVGDDVLGDDYTVRALEEKVADYFGMEDALFCPSGTMTNQIALQIHLSPGDEVICHPYSHIYVYEGGGIGANAQSSVKMVQGDRGLLKRESIAAAVNDPSDPHLPLSKLLSVENTCNKGGGACYDHSALAALAEESKKYGLAYHLDGARVWNALVAKDGDPKDYGKWFDTISVCLSKGLGCPVGSVLLGSHIQMQKGRRIRKRMGGGMRQAGYLAAAGIYALDHHVDRLAEDHARARILADTLSELSWVRALEPVETNIVIFYSQPEVAVPEVIRQLAEVGIHIIDMGDSKLRMVTHLDVSDNSLEHTVNELKKLQIK